MSMSTVKSKQGRVDDDIFIKILLLLPIKSLLRLICVCKSWRKLITCNEVFVRSHLKRASTNKVDVLIYSDTNYANDNGPINPCLCLPSTYDRFMKPRNSSDLPNPLYIGRNFEVVGCCDGIICYYKKNSRAMYLWNPALHQCRTILTPELYYSINYSDFVGFGYDPRNQGYKVVKLTLGKPAKGWLYNLKGNSWKSIASASFCDFRTDDVGFLAKTHPLSFKGSLHWIGQVPVNSHSAVVVFDIAHAKVDLFKIPNSVSITTSSFACLGILRGCLSFVSTANLSEWEIWSMKVYGVPSWTRETILDLELISRFPPIGFSSENDKLLLVAKTNTNVLWYDFETKRCSQVFSLVGGRSTLDSFFIAEYMESLISVMPSPSKPSSTSRPVPSKPPQASDHPAPSSKPGPPTCSSPSKPLRSEKDGNKFSIYFFLPFVICCIFLPFLLLAKNHHIM